jgi:hypothetical protein
MEDDLRHTPAPWFAERDRQSGSRVVRNHQGEIARLPAGDEADALLIAAAPDLLDAVRLLTEDTVVQELLTLLQRQGVAIDDDLARRIRLAEKRARMALDRTKVEQ